jgi:hypothetical protein
MPSWRFSFGSRIVPRAHASAKRELSEQHWCSAAVAEHGRLANENTPYAGHLTRQSRPILRARPPGKQRLVGYYRGYGLDPAAPVNAAQGDADRLIKKRQEIIDSMYQDVVAAEDNMEKADENTGSQPILKLIDQWFVRPTNLPTYPLDRPEPLRGQALAPGLSASHLQKSLNRSARGADRRHPIAAWSQISSLMFSASAYDDLERRE